MEPGPKGLPASESSRPTLIGDRWMAVTGHPLTVQVAGRVLEAGGNAVDAGVAAGLATNVVQVDMCNLAGIAPILVRPAGATRSSASLEWGDGLLRSRSMPLQPGTAQTCLRGAAPA